MPYILADSRAISNGQVLRGENVIEDYFSSNFDVKLSRPVNHVVGVELLHCEIPNSKSVVAGWNDKVYFYDNNSTASSIEVTLTPGYYTPDEFITMLNGLMTTAGTSTFTSDYDANSNLFTIKSTTNSRFLLFNEVIADAGISQAEYEAYFRALYLIGWEGAEASGSTTLSTSYEMDYEPDLRGVRYYTVDLELNGYGNQDIMTTEGSVSFLLPMNNNELVGFYNFNSSANYRLLNRINKVNVDNIRIKVFFEDSTIENEVLFFDTMFLLRLIKSGEEF